jgi:lysophospholipase L1-like esterase
MAASEHDEVGGIPVVRKQLVGRVDNAAYPPVEVEIRLSLTTPAKAAGSVPVVMEFGFGMPRGGSGATTRRAASGPPGARPGEAGPGWQEQVLARGWGCATLVPASVQADNGGGLTQGVIGLANKGQPRQLEQWGALRAWAWGASRALDYLESDKSVDAECVAIAGLSRYGKAALVTMAFDERFAAALVGSSGAGGAKLLRRDFGERVENLASSGEYHWFAGNFLKYAGPLTPADLPVDAHELIALCAPRPLFVGVGSPSIEGTWVDAKGMFMAAAAAGPVSRLLGKKDLGTSEMPPIETALVQGELAFRQHAGGHTNGPSWPTFLDFAGRYFGASTPTPATAAASAPTAPTAPLGPADQPAARNEDPTWVQKHAELLARAKQGGIELYFAGDSITRRWEATHRENWDHNFAGWRAAAFAAGGDRTQNALYRLENGELQGVHPKVVVLLIGTNNVGFQPVAGSDDALVDDVARGVNACLRAIRKHAPDAKVLLMGITPRNTEGSTALMPTIEKINARIAKFADGKTVRFLSINDKLADPSGKLLEGMTEDGLHLSDKGYQAWADAMRPTLVEWLGEPARRAGPANP